MIEDYMRFVVKTLLHRRVRSWLTIVGVVIGVAAILSLITLGQGMKNGIQDQFETLGISNIRVIPGNLNGPPSPGRTLPNSILDKLENVRGVDYLDPIVINNAIVTFNNEEQRIPVVGYDTSLGNKGFADIAVDIEDGRYLGPGDNDVAVIGYDIATDRFDKDIFAKNSIYINGKKFRVVGIFRDTGSEPDTNIYIPLETARELFNQHDTVNGVVVHLLPGIDMDAAAEDIKRRLLQDLDEDEFDLFTPEQILDEINQVLGVVQLVVGGIAGISVVVGAVGIMNAMFTSVLERTRQIGLMKAVGARNFDILALFIIEAGIIGLVGGFIGLVIGTALAYGMGFAINSAGFVPIKIAIEPTVVFSSLFFAFLIGIISGAVPAWKAAQLKPVDALRYE